MQPWGLLTRFGSRYGRKPPLLAGSVLMLVAGVGCALVPWFAVYLVLRFLSAVAVGAITVTGFVISECLTLRPEGDVHKAGLRGAWPKRWAPELGGAPGR